MGWAKVRLRLMLAHNDASLLRRGVAPTLCPLQVCLAAAQEWSQNLLKKLNEEEQAEFKAKSSAGIKFLLGKLKELQL